MLSLSVKNVEYVCKIIKLNSLKSIKKMECYNKHAILTSYNI